MRLVADDESERSGEVLCEIVVRTTSLGEQHTRYTLTVSSDTLRDFWPGKVFFNDQSHMCPGGGTHHLWIEAIDTTGCEQYSLYIGGQRATQRRPHVARVGQVIQDEQRGPHPGGTPPTDCLGGKCAERQNSDHTLRCLCLTNSLNYAPANLYQTARGNRLRMQKALQQRLPLGCSAE